MKNRETALYLALCLPWQGGTTSIFGTAMTGDGPTNAAGNSRITANANGIKSNAGAISGDIELNSENDSAPVPVGMKATATTSLISVSLSANGFELTMDPEQSFDINAPVTRITGPDVTIVSHSMVPVKLKIADVPEVGEVDVRFSGKFPDYAKQSLRLVNTISGMEPPGVVTLVLGTRDGRCGNDEESEHYVIRPGRTGIFMAGIPTEGEAVLKLCDKVIFDLYGVFEFTVGSTLKISTIRASETTDSYKK